MIKLLLTLVVIGLVALPLSTVYPAEDPMLRKSQLLRPIRRRKLTEN